MIEKNDDDRTRRETTRQPGPEKSQGAGSDTTPAAGLLSETWTDGGSYDDLRKKYQGRGEEVEIHHIPPNSASEVPREDGPAVAMAKEDHRELDSTRDGDYRQELEEGIEQSWSAGYREAFDSETADIQDRFGSKYDDGIAKAHDYAESVGLFDAKVDPTKER